MPEAKDPDDEAGAIACVAISRLIVQRNPENKLAIEAVDHVVLRGKQKAGGIAATRLM